MAPNSSDQPDSATSNMPQQRNFKHRHCFVRSVRWMDGWPWHWVPPAQQIPMSSALGSLLAGVVLTPCLRSSLHRSTAANSFVRLGPQATTRATNPAPHHSWARDNPPSWHLHIDAFTQTRQSKQCGFSIYIFDNSKSKSMHYRLRCSLGRFLSQKKFKSKVLFLSEKRVYLSRSSCFDKVMTQILQPKNCSKYLGNKILRY